MEKSKINSLLKRLATSLVLIPVVIGCVVVGYPLVYTLALLGAALLSWEWAQMVPNKHSSAYALTYFFVVTVAVLTASVAYTIVIGALALVLLLRLSKDETHRKLLLLGVPYITIGMGAIVFLFDHYGPWLVLWFLFLVWGVDTGGYVFGSTIKGPKLAPHISPNKTWAGLFGGMFFAMLISWGMCAFLGVSEPKYIAIYIGYAAVLAVIAQIGDLIESAIKRHLGLKDSSNLIPGHGGMFDRVDGLIFAAPFACVMLYYIKIFF
jgi:phosphatidate cytidylyltransferase